MKPSRFIRFYFLLFCAACVLIAGFTHLYKNYFSPPIYYSVNVDDVFGALQKNSPPEFRITSWNNLQVQESLRKKLQDGDVVAFTLHEDRYYLKSLDEKQLIQWGPVAANDWKKPGDNAALILFYSLLALLFLLILRPLFRDIDRLQESAIQFRKNPGPQPLETKRTSSVYPLARELYRMSQDLLDLVQVHKDLANIIAHELRTPLARMQFTLKRLEKKIPEKQRLQLKADIRALDRLAHEYLEFGQHHRSDHDYFQPIEISILLGTLHEKFEHTSPPLKIFDKVGGMSFHGNVTQIELAITNLINNAIRYAVNQIHLHVYSLQDRIVFSVEDDGPGFTQTFETTTTQKVGHKSFGLGLYIVKNVALHHGGSLDIGSSKLGGAKTQLSVSLKS